MSEDLMPLQSDRPRPKWVNSMDTMRWLYRLWWLRNMLNDMLPLSPNGPDVCRDLATLEWRVSQEINNSGLANIETSPLRTCYWLYAKRKAINDALDNAFYHGYGRVPIKVVPFWEWPDMHAEEIALWEAVKFAPNDDAPRLVLADWLDENANADSGFSCGYCEGKGCFLGTAADKTNPTCRYCKGNGNRNAWFADQAKFIRFQIEEANIKDKGTTLAGILRAAASEILDTWAGTWLAPFTGGQQVLGAYGEVLTKLKNQLGPIPVALRPRVFFRKGFVDEIRFTQAEFLEVANVAFACWPIRRVFLNDKRPQNTRKKSGGNSRQYTWFSVRAWDGRPEDSPDAPRSLVDHAVLPKYLMPHPEKRRCNYPNDMEATRALSESCIRWGRWVSKHYLAWSVAKDQKAYMDDEFFKVVQQAMDANIPIPAQWMRR